jgi:hypothetical protein
MTQSDQIVIVLSRTDADRVQEGLSDMLCWCNGFIAARPDDTANHPMGVHEARMINLKIKRALNEQ